jgi:diguanylate cyclase (GGDEF)-like protein
MSQPGGGEATSVEEPAPGRRVIDGDRVALGRALEERAHDIAARVLAAWHHRSPNAARAADTTVETDILRTTETAAHQVAHYLCTGEVRTEEQAQTLAATGKAPLRDTIALSELTKLYLYWREITIAALTDDARRLGTAPGELALAVESVRVASDASVIRMTKEFDSERRRLQAELAAEQARLAHQAFHDALTGLPNRRLFFDRLAHALDLVRRHGTGLALLYIDVDEFKSVNDRLGHLAGDGLLVAIAERLLATVRATDTVARLGGDEFVVLYEQLDDAEHDATALAQRITHAVGEPFTEPAVRVSASIGIAVTCRAEDPDALIRRADNAMYVAKRRGAGGFYLWDAA